MIMRILEEYSTTIRSVKKEMRILKHLTEEEILCIRLLLIGFNKQRIKEAFRLYKQRPPLFMEGKTL